jgi:putative pyruvate formate lyase activating enzyme
MEPSRRGFLKCFLAGAGARAVVPAASRPDSTDSSMQPFAPGRKKFEPAYLKAEREGRLARLETELWDVFRNCRLCPRQCGANRLKGEKGICSSTYRLKVYSAGPHFGEEKSLVGKGGSGTIFFSNCNLLCCFCQNWQINHRGDGEFRTHQELAEMMLDLQRRGCHNINLVTPTHVVPHIVRALRMALVAGLNLPLVYNTGGYDDLETVKKLDGIVDIYLPDFKYQDGRMAARYSSGATDYPEVAAAVIKEMHRQVGELRVDDRGIAERGLIIRHLVMPGNIAGTDRFVQWVARELTRDTYVNIMAQYHPAHRAFDYPEIARRISVQEWHQALKWAEEAGLRRLDDAG